MLTDEVRPQPAGQDAESTEFMETPNKLVGSDVMAACMSQTTDTLANLEPSLDVNKPIILKDEAAPVQTQNEVVNSTTMHNHERWSSTFEALIDDDEGCSVFYDYLESEQNAVLFDCWQRCQEYKNYPPNKATAKEIYTRYVRVKDARLPLSDQARHNLALLIRANNITENLLNEIESEIYCNLRDVCYVRFLKSDFFSYYRETCGQHSYVDLVRGKGPSTQHLQYSGNLTSLPENQTANFEPSSTTASLPAPCASKNQSEAHSMSSDAVTESDRLSVEEARSARSHRSRTTKNNHDTLPNPPNFRQRTQKMNMQKPMAPVEFARILTEKLEKVLEERKLHEQATSLQPTAAAQLPLPTSGMHAKYAPSEPCYSEVTSLPAGLPSERFPVEGASQYSGSSVMSENVKNYKQSAVTLVNAVKQQLRTNLQECNCEACFRNYKNKVNSLPGAPGYHEHEVYHHHTIGHPHRASTQHCRCAYMHEPQPHYPQHHGHVDEAILTHRNVYAHSNPHAGAPPHCIGLQEEHPPVDYTKIQAWMEKNEKYSQQKFNNPAPSPALRRKSKQPVMYNTSRPQTSSQQTSQPIATDPGMPPLPPPNTSTVLEEAKRRLKDSTNSSLQGTLRRESKNSQNGAQPPPAQIYRSQMPPSHQYVQHPHTMSPGHPMDPHNPGAPHHLAGHPAHQQPGHPHQQPGHPVYDYDSGSSILDPGMHSVHLSDSQSSTSFQFPPSDISTVPSSASRLWNMDASSDQWHPAYHMEPVPRHHPEVRPDHYSDTRSRSTGRSENRSGHHSEPRSAHHSEPRSAHHGSYVSDPRGSYVSEPKGSFVSDPKGSYVSDPRSSHVSDPRGMYSSDSRSAGHYYSQETRNRSEPRHETRSQSSAGRSAGSGNSKKKDTTTVTYFFGVDPIPFRITLPSKEVTLGKFKDQTKRGNFRYFFKIVSEDDGEVVFQELTRDDEFLPSFEGKIIGKVVKDE